MDWKWFDDLILLGSDVKSLFPSLSAKETGKAVRNQIMKSKIEWRNVNWKLMTLFIKLHENLWDESTLKDIRKYLPTTVTNLGRPPSLATENVETRFKWSYRPDEEVFSRKVKATLMGMAMECAIVFLF